MRVAIIILSLVSLILLITTGALGMSLRGGNEGVRVMHFHIAMTTATLSGLTHILTFICLLKLKTKPDA